MMNIFAKVKRAKRNIKFAIENKRWGYHIKQMAKHELDKDPTLWKRHAKMSVKSMSKCISLVREKEKDKNN